MSQQISKVIPKEIGKKRARLGEAGENNCKDFSKEPLLSEHNVLYSFQSGRSDCNVNQ